MGGRGRQPSFSAIGNGQKSIKLSNRRINKVETELLTIIAFIIGAAKKSP